MLAAFKRMRDRSTGGVCDQEGKALVPACTAASSVDCEEVYILATGSRVEGSVASIILESDDCRGEPLMKA